MAVRTAAEAKTAPYILYDKSQNGDIDVEGEFEVRVCESALGTIYALSIESCVYLAVM